VLHNEWILYIINSTSRYHDHLLGVGPMMRCLRGRAWIGSPGKNIFARCTAMRTSDVSYGEQWLQMKLHWSMLIEGSDSRNDSKSAYCILATCTLCGYNLPPSEKASCSRTIFPSFLLHQVIQLRRTITRMLGPTCSDLLLISFAPHQLTGR